MEPGQRSLIEPIVQTVETGGGLAQRQAQQVDASPVVTRRRVCLPRRDDGAQGGDVRRRDAGPGRGEGFGRAGEDQGGGRHDAGDLDRDRVVVAVRLAGGHAVADAGRQPAIALGVEGGADGAPATGALDKAGHRVPWGGRIGVHLGHSGISDMLGSGAGAFTRRRSRSCPFTLAVAGRSVKRRRCGSATVTTTLTTIPLPRSILPPVHVFRRSRMTATACAGVVNSDQRVATT